MEYMISWRLTFSFSSISFNFFLLCFLSIDISSCKTLIFYLDFQFAIFSALLLLPINLVLYLSSSIDLAKQYFLSVGPANVLPRCSLPKYFSEEVTKHVPKAIFSSNPCR